VTLARVPVAPSRWIGDPDDAQSPTDAEACSAADEVKGGARFEIPARTLSFGSKPRNATRSLGTVANLRNVGLKVEESGREAAWSTHVAALVEQAG